MHKSNKLIKASSGLSVAELFESQVNKNPASRAVIDVDGKVYNYKDFLERVLKLSSLLLSYEIQPHDRIAIISENRSKYLSKSTKK